MTMIYGASNGQATTDAMEEDDDDDDDDDNEDVIDTNRYDVAVEKLNLYRSTAVKRKLKSKFVTGKSSDQIVKNLLNMSDSEGEEDAEKRKLDKE